MTLWLQALYSTHSNNNNSNNNNNIIIIRFPAHDELGTCRTSLVSPEQPVLCIPGYITHVLCFLGITLMWCLSWQFCSPSVRPGNGCLDHALTGSNCLLELGECGVKRQLLALCCRHAMHYLCQHAEYKVGFVLLLLQEYLHLRRQQHILRQHQTQQFWG